MLPRLGRDVDGAGSAFGEPTGRNHRTSADRYLFDSRIVVGATEVETTRAPSHTRWEVARYREPLAKSPVATLRHAQAAGFHRGSQAARRAYLRHQRHRGGAHPRQAVMGCRGGVEYLWSRRDFTTRPSRRPTERRTGRDEPCARSTSSAAGSRADVNPSPAPK